jgi:hypothetical protein
MRFRSKESRIRVRPLRPRWRWRPRLPSNVHHTLELIVFASVGDVWTTLRTICLPRTSGRGRCARRRPAHSRPSRASGAPAARAITGRPVCGGDSSAMGALATIETGLRAHLPMQVGGLGDSRTHPAPSPPRVLSKLAPQHRHVPCVFARTVAQYADLPASLLFQRCPSRRRH